MPLFFRYLFVCLCALYTYCTVSNLHKHNTKTYIFLYIFISAFTASLISIVLPNDTFLRIFIVYVVSCFYMLMHYKANFSFTLMLLSLGVSFSLYVISGVFTSFLSVLICDTFQNIPHDLLPVYTGFLQIIFCIILQKSKRLSNGLRFLCTNQNAKVHLMITGIIIYNISFLSYISRDASATIRTVSVTMLLFLSLFFLVCWRGHITKIYKEKLRLVNEQALEKELHNKNREIAILKADNERLAHIIHKDNKLIPAMEKTIREYLEKTYCLTRDEQQKMGHSLSKQLQCMAKERQGILPAAPFVPESLPQTGLHTVDGMLSFMATRCKNENIDFDFQTEEDLKKQIEKTISESDLVHLLAELMDNAIHATRHAPADKIIRIRFARLHNSFLFEITDTGEAFIPSVYQNFGNTKYTTRPLEGGSGIGLLDIYTLKKKYNASLQIYEYPSGSYGASKKIVFIFDKKNHFLIQTYRAEELIPLLTRNDIYVCAHRKAPFPNI